MRRLLFNLLLVLPIQAFCQKLVVSPQVVNLGRVLNEKGGFASFTITNKSGTAVRLFNAQTSCGCASPELPTSIAAGKSVKVRVPFRPDDSLSGPMTEVVTVQTSLKGQPTIELKIKANLAPAVSVTPTETQKVPFEPGKPLAFSFTMRTRPGVKVKDLSIGASAFHVSKKTESNGAVKYTFSSPKAPSGDFQLMVNVTTVNPARSIFHLIQGEALSGPVASPAILTVPYFSLKDVQSEIGSFSVFSRKGRVRVTSAAASDKNIAVEILGSPSDVSSRISLKYKGGWQAGTKKGWITLATDDKRYPALKVPYIIVAG